MTSRNQRTLRHFLFAAAVALVLVSAHAGPSVSSSHISPLQQSINTAMRGRAGSAVLIDVRSGQLLGAYRLDVAARRLVHPGSTIKTFTLLAMLQNNVLTSDTALVCRRHLQIGERRLDCSHVRTVSALDPAAALSYSCNYYFAHFATQLADSALTQTLVSAGLTSRTGIVANEAIGKVEPSRSPDDLQLKALGESDVEVTPLEMLMAYRGLALRANRTPDPAVQIALAGLRGATEFGTAQLARVTGLTVAGKTGTAKGDEGRWTHGWFVGFTPATDPQIALVVFLERGNGPGDASAIAGSILRSFAQQRGQK